MVDEARQGKARRGKNKKMASFVLTLLSLLPSSFLLVSLSSLESDDAAAAKHKLGLQCRDLESHGRLWYE